MANYTPVTLALFFVFLLLVYQVFNKEEKIFTQEILSQAVNRNLENLENYLPMEEVFKLVDQKVEEAAENFSCPENNKNDLEILEHGDFSPDASSTAKIQNSTDLKFPTENPTNSVESPNFANSFDIHSIYDNYHPKTNDWMIIGFTSLSYIPAAIVWYEQLTALGYTNHYLIPTDKVTHQYFQNNLTSYRIDTPYDALEVKSNIWRTRLTTLYKFIKNGKNVFISDVDSIWVNHYDLNLMPPMFDAYHAICTTFPKEVYFVWGFVLCGGVGGYRSNPSTIKFFENMVLKCGRKCDDQRLLNEFYLEMEMSWKHPPGMQNKIGFIPHRPKNWKTYPKSDQFKPTVPMLSMTLSNYNVQRGKDWSEFQVKCADAKKRHHLWIISPNCPKTVAAKWKMFQDMAECFEKKVRDTLLRKKISGYRLVD